jgi:hypothetical protein
MKAIVLFTCMCLVFSVRAENTGQDSILLKIDKRNQTLMGTKSDKSKTLKEELTQVFEKKGLVLTDSLWQQIRSVIRTDSEGDSSLSVQVGNSRVKIGVIRSDRERLGQQSSAARNKPLDRIVEIGTNKKEVIDIGLK